MFLHLLAAIASLFTSHQPKEEQQKAEVDGLIDIEREYSGTTITDLVVYPMTGAQGVHLQSAKILMSGIEYDREWQALEPEFDIDTPYTKDKRFINMGKNESLGETQCRFEFKDGINYLVFTHPNQEEDLWVDVDHPPVKNKIEFRNNLKECGVYYTRKTCYSEGEEASKWFTKAIGRNVVLARSQHRAVADSLRGELNYQMKDGDTRNSGHHHAALHLISIKSMEELQTHIDPSICTVTTSHFRPNIIVEGIEAWEEDDIREFKICDTLLSFRVIYNSKRCKISCYDGAKKKLNIEGEPLKTLTRLRNVDKVGPVFGFFAQPDQECEISVGDKIIYTKRSSVPTKYI